MLVKQAKDKPIMEGLKFLKIYDAKLYIQRPGPENEEEKGLK